MPSATLSSTDRVRASLSRNWSLSMRHVAQRLLELARLAGTGRRRSTTFARRIVRDDRREDEVDGAARVRASATCVSSRACAVTKMIGVCSDSSACGSAGPSRSPSITGIWTSIRITANGALHHRAQRCLARRRLDRGGRAARATAMIARRLPSLSSTTRIAAVESASVDRRWHQAAPSTVWSAGGGRVATGNHWCRRGQQLGRVDRLRDVVGCAGGDAALALAAYDLAGDGDDRQVRRSSGSARIAAIVS